EGARHVDGERALKIIAFGVGEQRERRRPEAGGIVDQRVEAAEVPSDLERDWVDVLLAPDIADDAAGAGLPGDPLHVKGRACDEGDASATRRKIFDQRQSEARR